ncbi:GNAT family N-acetyltransferase [Candidatus Entotheonella serta]|nr:GNAT family N-acetyltransferase [Candidatus Entotheonella serta]
MEQLMEVSFDVTAQEREAILKPLRAYNLSHTGDMAFETVGILLRDPVTEEVVGGLYGKISYGWLFIELLSVPDQLRTQGTGSRLMRAAEELARQHGCTGIWLDTFSFQAPGFYRKLGFTEFGHIADYPRDCQIFCVRAGNGLPSGRPCFTRLA